jgi:hypothetical protein
MPCAVLVDKGQGLSKTKGEDSWRVLLALTFLARNGL